MARTEPLYVDVLIDTSGLRRTIDRIEGLIERLEALGNTPESIAVNYYVPQVPTQEELAAQLRRLAQTDYRKVGP